MGGVIWEGVDVVGGVMLSFEDIVGKIVEPLVDRGTESRKVSRKGLVMCCGVVEYIILEDVQGVVIADRCLVRGSIARIDVIIELLGRRQVEMDGARQKIATHGEMD